MNGGVSYFHAAGGKFADWLTQILGTWVTTALGGHAPDYVTHTIFSSILSVTGILSMVIALFIVSHAIFLQILSSATAAETFDEKSSATYAARTVLVIVLLIPVPYSASGPMPLASRIQPLLASVGSNFADKAWDKVVDGLISTPQIQAPISNTLNVAKQTLTNMVCAASVMATHPEITSVATTIDDAGHAHSVSQFAELQNLAHVATIQWAGGACGITSLNPAHEKSSGNQPDKTTYLQKIEALAITDTRSTYGRLITSLVPITKNIHDMGGETLAKVKPGATPADTKSYQALLEDAKDLNTAIAQYEQNLQKIPKQIAQSTIGDSVKKEMKKGGWAMAGVWYLELSNYQSILNNVLNNITVGTKTPSSCGLLNHFISDPSCVSKVYLNDMTDGVEAVYQKTLLIIDANAAGKVSSGASQAKLSTACNIHGCSVQGVKRSVGGWAGQIFVRYMTKVGSHFDNDNPASAETLSSGRVNPVWELSNLGRGYFYTATGLYTAKLILIGLQGAVKNEKSSWLTKAAGVFSLGAPGAAMGIAVALMSEAIKVLNHMISALFSNGFLLGYVVPFWPTLIWAFVIIGYLTVIMEAMLIAPLSLAQSLLPEGAGIRGLNMQRFFAICIGVFIRPFLYVIEVTH